MVKKSLLTPVLSGVLAVAVVGSGAYYFIDNKNAEKDNGSNESGNNSIKVSDDITNAAAQVSETVDNIKKAFNGELDFAYDASATIDFGDMATSTLGYDLDTIGFSASTKQKGQVTSADFAATYGGNTLASLNLVGDRTSNNIYAKIPELSSSYVSVNADDISSLMNQTYNAYGLSTDMSSAASMSSAIDAFKAMGEIDMDALATDLASYAQTVIDNTPEPTDGENKTGSVGDTSYDLKTKSYSITESDAMDIAIAVLEQTKEDKFIDEMLASGALSDSGITADNYDSYVDTMISSIKASETTSTEVLNFDVYYDSNNQVSGFACSFDGQFDMSAVFVINDTDMIIDCSFGDDEDTVSVVGNIKKSDDTLNGFVNYSIKADDTNVDMAMTLTNLAVYDTYFTGDMALTCEADAMSYGFALTSASTVDKTDITISADVSGSNFMTAKFLMEKTDASDITVPESAIAVSLTDSSDAGLDQYLATCDTDSFMSNLKTALGDDLYNAIFASTNSSTGGYDDSFDYGDITL